MQKPPKLPEVQQPTGQYREEVPSPTPFKRPSGEIRDMFKRIIVNPNKGVEERIKRLETVAWFCLIANFLTQITIYVILTKW